MNDKDIIIALPKGRILKQVLPIFDKVGIIPEKSFFNEKDRKLKFETNISNIKLILVRSFDVATFLIYGAAHIAIIGSDVLEEFNHSEIYSPIDLKIGLCRLVVATTKEILSDEDPLTWSYVRVATKYPNLTSEHFKKRGVHADCIKLNGAMELAPSMGLCRRIVDLSESGETLKANGLIEIEEIMKVSTRLAVNRNAYKTNFKEINQIIKKFEGLLHD
ncbi:MAG: ATP phosphoribosyltransferase [Alphaproteobacteria bacterium]|nr:MAG: ATP phosphoribosyltransferase [Alphaproteobacteria bacterium]